MNIRILAINTANKICSVALLFNKNLILEKFIHVNKKHAQYILVIIDSVLSITNITFDKIHALVLNYGPGNCIGIRIGIGITQGLSLGNNIPIIKISTLMTLAEGVWRYTGISKVLIFFELNIKKFYYSFYYRISDGFWLNKNKKIILSYDELIKKYENIFNKCINFTKRYKSFPKLLINNDEIIISNKILLPQSIDMIILAINKYKNNKFK